MFSQICMRQALTLLLADSVSASVGQKWCVMYQNCYLLISEYDRSHLTSFE
jgi:hypothetical protein